MSDISPNQGSAALPLNQESARVQLAAWLRHARERSGVSIDAVSQETRISKNYILSLESGNLDGLPGKVFGRGFVKNITRLLKTDTSEGLRLYDACWESPVINPSADEEEPKSKGPINAPRANVAIHAREAGEAEIGIGLRPQALSGFGKSNAAKFSIRIPEWIVHSIVSPQVRLWILAGLATIFVGLVFGRWAAGTLHKGRLVNNSHSTSVVSRPTKAASNSGSAIDATITASDKEMIKDAGITSAVLENEGDTSSLRETTVKNQNSIAPVVSGKAEAHKDALTASRDTATEDNPLYMPSPTGAAFEQIFQVRVSGDVDIKLTIDGKKIDRTKYAPDSYQFTFNDRAELHLSDASLVDVIYNGKSLGTLGNKGRKRRIVLQAKASQIDFPQ